MQIILHRSNAIKRKNISTQLLSCLHIACRSSQHYQLSLAVAERELLHAERVPQQRIYNTAVPSMVELSELRIYFVAADGVFFIISQMFRQQPHLKNSQDQKLAKTTKEEKPYFHIY